MSDTPITSIAAELRETSKHPLASKTIWLNAIALLSLLIPSVRTWLASNPVEAVAALNAANLMLRFVTRDRLRIFEPGEDNDFRTNGLAWICSIGVSMAAVSTLPSCSSGALAAFPVRMTVQTNKGPVTYSSKSGLTAEVDLRSRK